jgi:hypothetical protein
MLFYQAAAPTGWTKVTTHNDKALRVVNGAGGGAGGTNAFSTVLINAISVGGATLSEAMLGSHTHGNYLGLAHSSPSYWATFNGGGSSNNVYYSYQGDAAGGGGSHGHALTLGVQYIDLILASKN